MANKKKDLEAALDDTISSANTLKNNTTGKETHELADKTIDIANSIKRTVNEKTTTFDPEDDPDIRYTDGMQLIPSGSITLNMACSDQTYGAFALGRYANLIGDSSAGKSFLAISMLAEVAQMPEFDEYDFYYDDAEEANSFDVGHLFGQELANRLQPPSFDKDGEPVHSNTIQDFNLHVFDIFDKKKPFIYILDSFDALTSSAEMKTAAENINATRKGTAEAGTYGMDKPKLIGQILRQITRKLRSTKSFILIISQTRDNINPTSFTKKTRSGGNALKFYASHEIWLACKGVIKKTVNYQDRIIGVTTRAKVSKNKLTGKQRVVDFDIYYEYGIDDLGACIDFLVAVKHWVMEKKSIVATELDVKYTREKLIDVIESNDWEDIVFKTYREQWMIIENAVKPKRKKKFGR